jgi:hypothetical protein
VLLVEEVLLVSEDCTEWMASKVNVVMKVHKELMVFQESREKLVDVEHLVYLDFLETRGWTALLASQDNPVKLENQVFQDKMAELV